MAVAVIPWPEPLGAGHQVHAVEGLACSPVDGMRSSMLASTSVSERLPSVADWLV